MNLRNPPDDLKALLSKSLSLDKVYLEGSREQVLNVRHGGSEGLLSKKSSVIKHRQELEAFMSDYNKAYPNDKRASAQASFKELNKTIADDNDKIGEIDETLNSDWGDILASRKKFGTQWKQITSACSEFISDEVAPASSSGSTK